MNQEKEHWDVLKYPCKHAGVSLTLALHSTPCTSVQEAGCS